MQAPEFSLLSSSSKDDQDASHGVILVIPEECPCLWCRIRRIFSHTGKVGDLPVSVHALLPKLISRHEDGTETTVTPLPMWQP